MTNHEASALTWTEVKHQIRETLLERGLADPKIRPNALASLERLLQQRYPDLLQEPSIILTHSKSTVIDALARHKANGKLNSAEKSVLNNVYQVIGGQGMTTKRQDRTAPNEVSVKPLRAIGRKDSDENYVIDLCDEVLGRKALRQHRFDFLRGNARPGLEGVRLPVDAYYPDLKLVVEYRERQHTEDVTFFDKPDRKTVSGVHRGEQRRLYDARRREVLPQHGVELVELNYFDFEHDAQKRLKRSVTADFTFIKGVLARWVAETL